MGTEISLSVPPLDAMERAATYLVKSGLFGVKSPEQAIALMLVAHAEGRPFVSAITDYHVIQGRPALKADTMLARFQAARGRVEWDELTDTRVTGRFLGPDAEKWVTITWTIEDARRAGLGGKDVWKQYPRAMLRARVISEGVRTCLPAVLSGMYTVEEVRDFDARPPVVRHVPEPTKQLAVEYEADVTPPDPDFEREPGSDDEVAPRTYAELKAWVKGFGRPTSERLVEHLKGWATANGLPAKAEQYTLEQIGEAYDELCGHLEYLESTAEKASA